MMEAKVQEPGEIRLGKVRETRHVLWLVVARAGLTARCQ